MEEINKRIKALELAIKSYDFSGKTSTELTHLADRMWGLFIAYGDNIEPLVREKNMSVTIPSMGLDYPMMYTTDEYIADYYSYREDDGQHWTVAEYGNSWTSSSEWKDC